MQRIDSNEANLSRSREWLEAILDSIADAVIATDDACAITGMNAVAERLTGWTLDEARHKSLGDVLVIRSQATGAPLECPLGRVLSEGTRAEHALPDDAILVRRDGSEIPIDDSVSPIRDQRGALVGGVICFRDVSARRRELDRLAFLADASVELNASLDYEVTLSMVAKLAVPAVADGCQVVMVVDAVIKPLAVAHVDPDKARMVLAQFDPCELDPTLGPAHVIATGEPQLVPEITPAMIELATASERCREMIRQLRPKSYIGVPLKRGSETIGAISLVMADSGRRYDASDLSVAVALAERAASAVENARLFKDRCLARAEAEARRTEAELANRTKDEFLAVLGHELRNPLAPIVTALELMKLKSGDSRERIVIERQVKHLARLVDDLLDISRITRAKVVLTKEPVEVAQIVADGIDLASPLLESGRHAVTASVEPGTWVEADAVRLAQVVSNLVNNAAKYSEPGGPIWIEAHREDGEVVLRVRDGGIGIDPGTLSRIFEPFIQAPQALDRAHGGLGLGLAIVRGLVDLHGGSVSAHSAGPGRGSEFVVRLPACERSEHQATDVGSQLQAPHRRGARILVVDDNTDALALQVEMLRLLGYEVIDAADALSALALAQRVRPSLALLDIGLPVMDGYELARRLRAIDGLTGIKLVAMTGYGLDADRARSHAAGFDEHLVKPATMESVQSVLERLTSEAPQDLARVR
jgi:PAS domain S-box-containing protein